MSDRSELLTGRERTLASLALAWQARRADSALYEERTLVHALALDARERMERMDAVEQRGWNGWIDTMTRRIERRMLERRLGVRCVREAPAARSGIESAPIAEVLRVASARRMAPLLDLAVAAGSGRELWDAECDQYVPLPHGIPRGRYVAMRVAGDSMTPLMHSGDVVLVHLGAELRRGSVVVARVADGGYVVKQVGRIADRLLELRSLNPAYPPLSIRRTRSAVVGAVVLCWCSHEPAEIG